jgi:hypothetical protein
LIILPIAAACFIQKQPVRFLSMASDGTLCFSYDGQLYTQKTNGSAEKTISDIGRLKKQ